MGLTDSQYAKYLYLVNAMKNHEHIDWEKYEQYATRSCKSAAEHKTVLERRQCLQKEIITDSQRMEGGAASCDFPGEKGRGRDSRG